MAATVSSQTVASSVQDKIAAIDSYCAEARSCEVTAAQV